MMARFSIVQEHSIRFDKNLVIGPDWDFWIQLALHVEFGYLHKITSGYRIHDANITRTVDMNKRKRDRIFGRSKVMNSDWFINLSVITRELFFLDLLVTIMAGDAETQMTILQSEQFSKLPANVRSRLWRMVGVDVLQNKRDRELTKRYFMESLKLNADDYKTRFILFTLWFGTSPALAAIQLWRLFRRAQNRISGRGLSSSVQLQKLFGMAW